MHRRTFPLLAAAALLVVGSLPARADISGEIAVMNADGSGDKVVTKGTGTKSELAWSPSADRIAYTEYEGTGNDANANLFVMAADGSKIKRLANDPVGEHGPSWSADGKRLAFWRVGQAATELYSVTVDTGEVAALSQVAGTVPVLSPDWSKVAYSLLEDKTNEIYVVENGKDRKLTSGPGSKFPTAWSPDGMQLAYTVLADENTDVWVVNSDGTGAHQVTTEQGFDGGATWSPDGKSLAFYTTRGDFLGQIFAVGVDGKGERNLSNRPTNSEGNPAWSSTGRIAFVRR